MDPTGFNNPSKTVNASPEPPLIHSRGPHLRFLILFAVFLVVPATLVVGVVTGVTSYFRPSSATKALRNGLIESSGVEWRQRIALNVGGLTFGAVRGGLSFFPLDARARAALGAVCGAEVGIYELVSDAERPDCAAMLAAADKAMTSRGWDRVVGVIDGDNLITVYISEKTTSARRLECCVMVFDGEQMILASALANLQPLVQIALEETTANHKGRFLSKSPFR